MKIIVMGGSFNPPTIAHQKLLLSAVNELNADRGIFVPSSHSYVEKKLSRSGKAELLLPEQTRLDMLNAMAADDPRLTVDDLEYRRTEKSYTYETLLDISEKYPEATVCFLAGGDKLDIFPRWHRIREFLDRFKIVVVKRDGEDPVAEIEKNEFLHNHKDSFLCIEAPEGIDGISSSAVRESISHGSADAEKMCHPKVYELLMKHMDCSEICGFFDEYRFLSNFWEAPVTYLGITYQNNEAAFQAQKCLSNEEKLEFAELKPNVAKGLGRRVQLRPDWETVKVGIMEEIVRAKFTQNEDLAAKLIATGSRPLLEVNTWRDYFWGVDMKTHKGQNNLGIILMKIRSELQK